MKIVMPKICMETATPHFEEIILVQQKNVQMDGIF